MKVGIAGTGKIVREFLNMQKDQERIEVTALVCRPQSEKTGRELAEQYGIPALYTDYETFLKEAEMDAVYLGIVNQMHAFYAEKALLAGRNVINERGGETGETGQGEASFPSRSHHASSFSKLPLYSGAFKRPRENHDGPGQFFPVFQPL